MVRYQLESARTQSVVPKPPPCRGNHASVNAARSQIPIRVPTKIAVAGVGRGSRAVPAAVAVSSTLARTVRPLCDGGSPTGVSAPTKKRTGGLHQGGQEAGPPIL